MLVFENHLDRSIWDRQFQKACDLGKLACFENGALSARGAQQAGTKQRVIFQRRKAHLGFVTREKWRFWSQPLYARFATRYFWRLVGRGGHSSGRAAVFGGHEPASAAVAWDRKNCGEGAAVFGGGEPATATSLWRPQPPGARFFGGGDSAAAVTTGGAAVFRRPQPSEAAAPHWLLRPSLLTALLLRSVW